MILASYYFNVNLKEYFVMVNQTIDIIILAKHINLLLLV